MTRATCRVLVVYAVLMAAWPSLAPIYRALFRCAGAIAIAFCVDDTLIEVRQEHASIGRVDTLFAFERNATSGQRRTTRVPAPTYAVPASSFLHSYTSVAVLLALLLGSGRGWHWRRGSTAILLLLGFLTAKLLLLVEVSSHARSPSPSSSDPILGAADSALLAAAVNLLLVNQMLSYVLPILIWAACFATLHERGRATIESNGRP